jgi:hypothetical protein
MDPHEKLDRCGDETSDSQRKLVFIDIARNLRGVNNFLWRSSGEVPLVQRIAFRLFGLGFLFGGIIVLSFLPRADSALLAIVMVTLSLALVALGVRVFLIGSKGRKRRAGAP